MMIMPVTRFAPQKIAAIPTVSSVFSHAFRSEGRSKPNQRTAIVPARAVVSSTTKAIRTKDCTARCLLWESGDRGRSDTPDGQIEQPCEPFLAHGAHQPEPRLGRGGLVRDLVDRSGKHQEPHAFEKA